MTDEKAYDLGRFQRIVGVEGPMVHGNFTALSTRDGSDTIVQPLEVTIYHDESHHSGRILTFGELTAWVHPDGSVDMSKHSIREDKLAEVESVWDEMVAAVRLVAEAAKFEWKDKTDD